MTSRPHPRRAGTPVIAWTCLGIWLAVVVLLLTRGTRSPGETWSWFAVLLGSGAAGAVAAWWAGRPWLGVIALVLTLAGIPLVVTMAYVISGP